MTKFGPEGQRPNDPHRDVVKIGKVEFPRDQRFEQLIIELSGPENRQRLLILPLLSRLECDPHTHPNRFDRLLAQILCYPDLLSDHSFLAQSGARARSDLSLRLANQFMEGSSFEPDKARFAATRMCHYLEPIAAPPDRDRLANLRLRFGEVSEEDAGIPKIAHVAVGMIEVNEDLAGIRLVLPEKRSVFLRSERPQEARVPEFESQPEKKAPDSVVCIKRDLRLQSVFAETTKKTLMQSEYEIFDSFFNEPIEEVFARKSERLAATGSHYLNLFARITSDEGSSVIDENKPRKGYKGSFDLEIPQLLVFNTKSFGMVTVTNRGINIGMRISAKDFELWDTPKPVSAGLGRERWDLPEPVSLLNASIGGS